MDASQVEVRGTGARPRGWGFQLEVLWSSRCAGRSDQGHQPIRRPRRARMPLVPRAALSPRPQCLALSLSLSGHPMTCRRGSDSPVPWRTGWRTPIAHPPHRVEGPCCRRALDARLPCRPSPAGRSSPIQVGAVTGCARQLHSSSACRPDVLPSRRPTQQTSSLVPSFFSPFSSLSTSPSSPIDSCIICDDVASRWLSSAPYRPCATALLSFRTPPIL